MGIARRKIALLSGIEVKSLSLPPMESLRSCHKDFKCFE
jgi:hypothetical protein